MKNHPLAITAITALLASSISLADGSHSGGIHAPIAAAGQTSASFDIVHAKIVLENNIATFQMTVNGQAGALKPAPIGKLAGANVYSYVWPTTLNSAVVGFEKDAGILALAVTAHPDFDDTPLYDENQDQDPANDGNVWHSHWVVLKGNDSCGKGNLAVVDIAKDTTPRVPKTWPGLPILLDSPGWDPIFSKQTLTVKVPFAASVDLSTLNYDGVTAGLRVNQSLHAPLLCVVDVLDIASGELSLPGKLGY